MVANNYTDYASEIEPDIKSGVTDYASEILGDSAAAAIEKPVKRDPRTGTGKAVRTQDFWPRVGEAITGGQRKAATPETRTMPELMPGDVEGPGLVGALKSIPKQLNLSVKLLTSADDEEWLKSFERINPGTKTDRDNKGNVFVTLPDGKKRQLNKPGLSFADTRRILAEVGKYIPAGRVATAVRGIKGVAAGGATAAATSAINEALSEDFQIEKVAIEGALGAGGPAIGRIPDAVRKSNAAMVGLTSLKKNNKQLADSVENWLYTKADDVISDKTPARARKAAEKAYKDQIRALQSKASPLYKAADDANPSVNLDEVYNSMLEVMDSYGRSTPFYKAAEKALGYIEEAKNFKQLNGAQKSIREMISEPKVGEQGLSREVRRTVKGIHNKLLAAMDDASPDFKQARSIYAEGMTEANLIADGIAGRLARIKEAGIEDISKRLFNQNPRAIKQTAAVMEKADPGVMEDLAYLHFRDQFDTLTRFTTEEIADKPTRIMNAILPTRKSQGILEVLPPDTKRALKQFDKLMREAEELKPDVRRDVIGQGLWAPLGLPYRAAKKAGAAGEIVQKQVRARAILEALTNREALNTKLMKYFLAMPIKGEKGVKEGVRILTQLTDEIANTIPDQVIQEEAATQETEVND